VLAGQGGRACADQAAASSTGEGRAAKGATSPRLGDQRCLAPRKWPPVPTVGQVPPTAPLAPLV
jgi:hypothetical protein